MAEINCARVWIDDLAFLDKPVISIRNVIPADSTAILIHLKVGCGEFANRINLDRCGSFVTTSHLILPGFRLRGIASRLPACWLSGKASLIITDIFYPNERSRICKRKQQHTLFQYYNTAATDLANGTVGLPIKLLS